MTDSTISFSADYLRSLPEKLRQKEIDLKISQIISSFSQILYEEASLGKTSYLYVIPTRTQEVHHQWIGMQVVSITPDQLVGAFEKKFPGCKIIYNETWNDTSANTRVCKKGIMIDWSSVPKA